AMRVFALQDKETADDRPGLFALTLLQRRCRGAHAPGRNRDPQASRAGAALDTGKGWREGNLCGLGHAAFREVTQRSLFAVASQTRSLRPRQRQRHPTIDKIAARKHESLRAPHPK